MLQHLNSLAADPILGLSLAFQQDTNPNKIDLGVGVYKDESGHTPILASVREAQRRLIDTEDTKAYQGGAGNARFNELLQDLVFTGVADAGVRVRTLQTPGGCGALRLGAELIIRSTQAAGATASTLWVSTPTWANHIPLLGSAGLNIEQYPYFNPATQGIDYDAMMSTLEQLPAGDYVLLHACCHNPCGTDLSNGQWRQLASLMEKRGLIPFVDMAYQGFGLGVGEDTLGIRILAEAVPEMLVATSCSKNFGLYRERTGAISVMAGGGAQADIGLSHLQSIARGIYSMPPAHGASVVEIILADSQMRQQWLQELTVMRERIANLRVQLANALGQSDFGFITRQRGMFSFLGLNEDQVRKIRDEYSVYMVDSSRINIAGINQGNLDLLQEAIRSVL